MKMDLIVLILPVALHTCTNTCTLHVRSHIAHVCKGKKKVLRSFMQLKQITLHKTFKEP